MMKKHCEGFFFSLVFWFFGFLGGAVACPSSRERGSRVVGRSVDRSAAAAATANPEGSTRRWHGTHLIHVILHLIRVESHHAHRYSAPYTEARCAIQCKRTEGA